MAGVDGLNRLIQQDMPAIYASMGGATRLPEVKPVQVPVRQP